jgi:hypothetical protein
MKFLEHFSTWPFVAYRAMLGVFPGVPGACSQAKILDDLHTNLRQVRGTLIEDGVKLERQFVGTQCI